MILKIMHDIPLYTINKSRNCSSLCFSTSNFTQHLVFSQWTIWSLAHGNQFVRSSSFQLCNWKTRFCPIPWKRHTKYLMPLQHLETRNHVLLYQCKLQEPRKLRQLPFHNSQTMIGNGAQTCNTGWVPGQLPSCLSRTDQHIQHQTSDADQPKILQRPRTSEGSHSAIWRSNKQK